MVSMPLRERLWPRLLLSHISLATIPVLIIGIILISTARDSIETSVAEGNFEVARRASNEIRLYLEQAQSVIQQVADNMGMLNTTPLDRQRLIDNVVVRHKQFRELAVLDLEGRETTGTRLYPRGGAQHDRSPGLPTGDGATISRVFISDDQLPMVTITVPIMHFNQIVGYVTADVNLKDMWDLVDSVRIGGQDGHGYGYAYVVSEQGLLIAHPERERVYRQEDVSATIVGQMLQTRQSGTFQYEDRDGGERVAAFAPIEPVGWRVVIEQPSRAAFARSREMKWQVSLLMIFSAAVASLIGIFYARKIARPIQKLVRGTQLFAQGQLTRPIEVPGNGELTMLASEFNHMARQLSEKERQLQQAERLATLSKFASILSHELRNPLNSMVINMQILKRELTRQSGWTDKMAKYHDIVLSEIWRIDALVEQFLSYARPSALNRYPHNVSDIVNEVVAAHQANATEHGIRIETVCDQTPVWASVDADQLKQVFLNIILNAFDAMENGGTLTVVCREQPRSRTDALAIDTPPRRYLSVSFSDTGGGIDEAHLPHIFDVYYTSKSNGTGLGLPIAQQIVEKHGGKIEVTSQKNKGTTVTVWLPALSDETVHKESVAHTSAVQE